MPTRAPTQCCRGTSRKYEKLISFCQHQYPENAILASTVDLIKATFLDKPFYHSCWSVFYSIFCSVFHSMESLMPPCVCAGHKSAMYSLKPVGSHKSLIPYWLHGDYFGCHVWQKRRARIIYDIKEHRITQYPVIIAREQEIDCPRAFSLSTKQSVIEYMGIDSARGFPVLTQIRPGSDRIVLIAKFTDFIF